jgi:hypothetical protein
MQFSSDRFKGGRSMKKYMLVSLVIAFLLVTVGGPCLAGTVSNTSKKGSLLIIPLIRTDIGPNGEQWETLLTFGNDYPVGVNVQCVFVLKNGCNHQLQFDFLLTANQPVTFRASDGFSLEGDDVMGGGIGVGQVAEAKCWAKQFVFDDDDAPATTQMSFNHLSGEATLLRTVAGVGYGAATYNFWRFAANAPLGSQVGTPGELLLTGTTGNYDSCPASLLFDFLKQTPEPTAPAYTASVDNFIALVPCKQDVSQNGGPTVLKTRILRWDENESSASGTICVNCFFADSADNVVSPQSFPNVNTPAGVFRAEPFAETGGPCNLTSAVTYPVVGVLVKRFTGFLGPIVATTPTASGEWVPGGNNGTPVITWDPY